ncbi:hypothetical protein [Tenacibaculum sp. M341]|uniref:hypothetical protein n=1 Tax=Tenacibaculum sp. M341 TaxID=2530339 RepID=UPI001047D71E|nr:hypothetical protein [Tenacibaculum sp. M341]TCI92772.1 hypothetical protein EYW44_07700 [Tenacibaculum sp. M341]
MNLIKKTFSVLLISFLTFFQSCSECDNENPTAKITNLGTSEVSVQIKTSGGNTENINNIDSGNSSSATSYAPGEITYTIVVKDGTELEQKVTVDFCEDYTIIVNPDNTITTTSVPRD